MSGEWLIILRILYSILEEKLMVYRFFRFFPSKAQQEVQKAKERADPVDRQQTG